MKRLTVRSCAITVTSVLCLATALRLSAQTTAPAAAAAPKDDEPTLVLSPFVVEATEDSGYSAKDTLAGTRVRTELKDSSSAISVVTQQFLQDTGSKNAQDLLVYTTSTEVGGLKGNFSGQGGASVYQEVLTNPNNTTRVRGLDSADNTRDYFLTDIPFDTFNVGRIDMQRGPNSILFGVGSPAGIINSSMNPASFKTAFKLENVTSSYNSQRNSIDLNYVIVPQTLAVRFAALNSQQKYEQKPAFNNETRYYGALRFDPKIFNGEGSHTSLRANYENGTTKSNNPRSLPPQDQITPFFATGADSYGNVGINRQTINEYIPGQGNNSTLVNSTYNVGGWREGRTDWPTALNYFNGSSSKFPGVSPAVTSSIPTNVISGMINSGWVINAAGLMGGPYNPGTGNATGGIAGMANYKPQSIPDYQQWAQNSKLPGGTYYADQVLTDPSIFNFYKLLLDGPNKREWQNWNAYNIALSQTFFNDKLGFELAYDNQTYQNGTVGFLQGTNYAVAIDPNVVLADGSRNPNVGRPMVANSSAGGNTETNTSRNSTRFTVYADVRAEDYMGKTEAAKIIGRHVFTALYNVDHKTTEDHQWSQFATDYNWEAINNLQQNTKLSNYRQFDWVDYIGPTLAGASSAANAHLTNITNIIAPQQTTSVTYFNSHWNKSSIVGSANYVDPAAVYTYLASDTGVLTTSTQSNNPANYVGWQQTPVTYLSANNPAEFPSLVSGGKTIKFKDTSKALTWQGYFFDGDLAVTYGWRKDDVVNYATAAPVDLNTGITALNYGTDLSSRETVSGQSRTWGAVYHLPKSLTSKLPGHTTISFFYNHGNNFKADILRTNLAGVKLPNANGQTKEYGITITTLDDKLSLKVNRFDTLVKGATFNVTNGNSIAGLGGNGYWLWAAPSWGYGYAANLQYGLQGHYGVANASSNQWNYAWQDANSAGGSTAAQLAALGDPNSAVFKATPQYTQEVAIVNAWLALPVSDGFFNYFGINPVINPAKAHASGNLYDAFDNWNNGAPVGGQQPGAINAVSTVDNHSTGTEYELSAQPTKNWNVTINYARTEATKTNIDPATLKFMADNKAFFDGPGGQLRLWGVGNVNTSRTQQIGYDWVQNIYNAYLVSALAAGQSAPEVSPWRFNLVTTYNFDSGALKGAFVGGGLRMEAGRILGYQYNAASGALDVTKPWIGSSDNHADLWIGYTKKFSNKLHWRIQLNLRDVGESTRLVASRYQPGNPDGSTKPVLALARIQDGMSWQLTNSIEF